MANNKKGNKKKGGVPAVGIIGGGIFNATSKKNFPVLKKISDTAAATGTNTHNSKKTYVSPYSIKAI